jgi:hypothetical protein
LENSRVFVAFAGFGSHSLLSFEWYLVIVQRWVMIETNRTKGSVGLAYMSLKVRLLVRWADAFRLEPDHTCIVEG